VGYHTIKYCSLYPKGKTKQFLDDIRVWCLWNHVSHSWTLSSDQDDVSKSIISTFLHTNRAVVLFPHDLSLQRKSDMLSRLVFTVFTASMDVIMKIPRLIPNERQSHKNRLNRKQSNNIPGLSILDLSPEIVDEVLSYLPVVSQACLVLSCKRLYLLFDFILKNPTFEYPYSNGLDISLDLSNRTELLIALESQRWRYCAACLKLHPLGDFDQTSLGYENPILRACRWPGIIVLCPCLKLRAKRFGHQASQYVLTWHRCSYSSLSEGLSYDLKISLSVQKFGFFVFNFHYLIYVDSANCYRARSRIMLCPHKDALQQIKSNGRACVGSALMDCPPCSIFADTLLSDDCETYDIQFTREFNFGSFMRTRPPFTDRTADYNWRRYTIFFILLTQLILANVFKGVNSPFWPPGIDSLHYDSFSHCDCC
jgi:hypothetical protein